MPLRDVLRDFNTDTDRLLSSAADLRHDHWDKFANATKESDWGFYVIRQDS